MERPWTRYIRWRGVKAKDGLTAVVIDARANPKRRPGVASMTSPSVRPLHPKESQPKTAPFARCAKSSQNDNPLPTITRG